MTVSRDAVMEALSKVNDPEIKKPITEIGMVDGVEINGPAVTVGILLTTSGCPLRDTITRDVQAAAGAVEGV